MEVDVLVIIATALYIVSLKSINNHTHGYIWQNENKFEGLKLSTGKGSRLIISHAESSSFGFVAGSKLVFRCQSGTNVDYHTKMNSVIVVNCNVCFNFGSQ